VRVFGLSIAKIRKIAFELSFSIENQLLNRILSSNWQLKNAVFALTLTTIGGVLFG
jgi:hypothetical protein